MTNRRKPFSLPAGPPSASKFSLFTLIELLVVIAIIAILAAMLMPALQKAREAAKKTDCVSRLKSLGTKFHMYTDIYDDWFPYADTGLPKGYTWPMALSVSDGTSSNLQQAKERAPSGSSKEWFYKANQKFYKEYHCPKQNLMLFDAISNLAWGGSVTSYVSNGSVLGRGNYTGTAQNGKPMKRGLIRKAGTVGLLWDSQMIEPESYSRLTPTAFNAGNVKSDANVVAFGLIHGGICNILYADGHVGSTGPAEYLPIAMAPSSPYVKHPTAGGGVHNWLLPRD